MVTLNNELNNLTRELQKKNIQLDQLNKVKNQFLGMAAHDLRNPIGTILMFTEFVLEEHSDCISEECMQMMEIIHNSSRFMLNLLDELLDVVKIEAGKLELKPEKINIDTFVSKNIAINAMIATKKQIRIVKNVIDELPDIEADPANWTGADYLITNARKFSPAETTIRKPFGTGNEIKSMWPTRARAARKRNGPAFQAICQTQPQRYGWRKKYRTRSDHRQTDYYRAFGAYLGRQHRWKRDHILFLTACKPI